MPRRELLSSAQRAEMLMLPPTMSEQMLARYYTLSSDDLARIRQRRRPYNRLGFAVQLAYLSLSRTNLDGERRGLSPGRSPTLATQLEVNPMSIVQYARDREATRFEHLTELQQVYGFRPFPSVSTKNFRCGSSHKHSPLTPVLR